MHAPRSPTPLLTSSASSGPTSPRQRRWAGGWSAWVSAWLSRWIARQDARLARLGWDRLDGLPRGY